MLHALPSDNVLLTNQYGFFSLPESFIHRIAPQEQVVDIDVVTINSLVTADERVDVVHLDIGGRELAALRGAFATLRRCRPVVVVEGITEERIAAYRTFFANNLPNADYRHAGSFEGNSFHIPAAS